MGLSSFGRAVSDLCSKGCKAGRSASRPRGCASEGASGKGCDGGGAGGEDAKRALVLSANFVGEAGFWEAVNAGSFSFVSTASMNLPVWSKSVDCIWACRSSACPEVSRFLESDRLSVR